MDPVSFAVGIIGLAGLFSTCLDVVERLNSFKEFGNESRAVKAQFKAQSLRLQKWGQAVGFQGGTLMESHNRQLDDPRTFSIVEELLSAIRGFAASEDGATAAPESFMEHQQSFRDKLWMRQNRPTAPPDSKREKIGWALRNKARKMAQVGQFCSLVDQLHSLIPVSMRQDEDGLAKIVESGRGDDSAIDRGRWIAEFGQILSSIENEIEGLLLVSSSSPWLSYLKTTDEIKRHLHPWLLGSDPQNELFEISASKRIGGTCEWPLSRSWFLDWSYSDFPSHRAKMLWINGTAGFGKSVLCARIIEHMTAISKSPVAHFFFSSDFESRRDPFIAMRSWISQLMSHSTAFALIRQKESANQNQRSSRSDIVQLFQEIVTNIPQCTFIIDGLDECSWVSEGRQTDDSDSVFNFFEALTSAIKGTQTRILIVSRDEPEIRNCFNNENERNIDVYCYKIKPDDVRSDTEAYSRSIVNKKLSNRAEATKEDIAMKLSDRCNGQFLWVKMQEDCLRSGKSQKKIEETINSTPAGLEHIYERNWQKISRFSEEDRERTISLLRWAAFALRPLTVNEMTGAVLVSSDSDEVQLDDLPDNVDEDYINTEILGLCGSLIEIRIPQKDSHVGLRTVHLAHFSVKQYLLFNLPTQGKPLQMNSMSKGEAEVVQSTILARLCLCFIDYQHVWTENADENEDTSALTAFRNYAAGAWFKHASLGNLKDEKFINLVNQLFDTANPSWGPWKTWFDLNYEDGGRGGSEGTDSDSEGTDSDSEGTSETSDIEEELSGQEIPPGQDGSHCENTSENPIYYAACLGLTETMSPLIQKDKRRINDKGNAGRTALVAASGRGDLQIVQILLDNGADLTIRDDEGHTPLTMASLNGNYEVTKLLLDKEADIQSSTASLMTPLHCASVNGHLGIAQLLLNRGANIEAQNKIKQTPLNATVSSGHLELTRLLLVNGADSTTPDDMGRVPFYTAARQGSIELVQFLYEYGPDINVSTQTYQWTPINAASSDGHIEVVEFLIEKGADINKPNVDLETPVIGAASGDHLEVLKVLVENGAAIEAIDLASLSALHHATSNNSLPVVNYLLEKGANVDAQRKQGWTALTWAADDGYLEIAKLLIKHGAKLELANNDGTTPLYAATLNGHSDMVKMLLEMGANVDAQRKQGWTALICAVYDGNCEIAKLLIEHGAKLELANNDGTTPLYAATLNGHSDMVKMLLEMGANVDAQRKQGWTALNCAVYDGNCEIAKLLIEHGAKLDLTNNEGSTPLYMASLHGHLDVVKMLLEKGANVDAQNKTGRTALTCAASDGNFETAKLLTEHGAKLDLARNDGTTPLCIASGEGHLDIARILLEKGANYHTANSRGRTPVSSASLKGHAEVVQLLLTQSPMPSLKEADKNGYSALNLAAYYGHLETLNLLLEHNADIESKNNVGQTPLLSAVWQGHIKVVKVLLAKGADHLVQDNANYTAINVASANGHTEVVKILLAQVPSPSLSAPDRNGWTPLNKAAYNGHLEIVTLLMEHGADIESKSNKGMMPLHSAIKNGHTEVIRLLLAQKPSPLTWRGFNGATPLIQASMNGNVEILKMILEKGAEITLETKDNDGMTPINLAALLGRSEGLKLLIDKGADINTQSDDGWTAIRSASSNGHLEAVKILLDGGADVHKMGDDQWTPLHAAALNHGSPAAPAVVELLLKHGANMNLLTNKGKSMLHIAAICGSMEIIEHILDCSYLETEAQDFDGRTPFFLAAQRGHVNILQFLQLKNASMDQKDRYGATPLIAAVKNGHKEVVEYLLPLTNQSSITAQSELGRNLLWWALGSGCEEVIDLVRQSTETANSNDMEINSHPQCSSVKFDPESSWCDVCTRSQSESEAYQVCTICPNFFICLQCVGFGAKCLDSSHIWRDVEAQPGS
ncbi:hypothetical protein N7466_008404 [Penicillium verhagenii]|uniref:uncharacterized protein n=1 Tax=Penicillium verhagenii TaxID=1562060 RepID=UPI002544D980|nr:uncharacterized protein N7466_008404 [Penicillium verhagenii]KAJ5924217.1 hypothetical protein N7466_008404 [Penicillium verhagenii]